MTDRRTFRLVHAEARRRAAQECANAPDGYVVTVAEPSRSLEQNAVQWPILHAFAEQLQWPVNGALQRLKPDEWKDILTAAFERETARIAQGLDGGAVMLGSRTSTFGKKRFSEWLDFLHATAAARGVNLSHRRAA